MDIGDALTDMWRSVLLFVPKALAFLAILLVGYLIARVVRKLVDALLTRVGFDKAVRRSGIGERLDRSRYDASDILARLAYYAILLFALQLAFGIWGPNPISDLISAVVGWLPKAFIAIVILVVATAIASAVRDLIGGALGGLSYGRLIATVVWVFIVGLGVIAALNQVGIATTVTQPVLVAVLATVAGILIVGVGGGLVRPMQGRWERWLDRVAAESAVIRERARAYQAEKAAAEQRRVDEAAEAERSRAEAARVEAARAEATRREAAAPAPAPVDVDRAETTVISTEAEQTQVIPRPEEVHIVPGMSEPTPARGLPVAGAQPPAADEPTETQVIEPAETQVIKQRDGKDA
ncbi:Conserved TM helix [Asanoa hainanensis]|uniref:Conserved TM helix n=1 Tax=Asanoa hainanensis TaxID=560556 RepID=A0A239PF27_9ACTN|nr:Conserved TM helix [Asanoa hainanensis]